MPPIQIRTVIFIDSLITKRHSIPKYIKYTYKNEKFSHVSFLCLQIFATELKTSLCKQGSIITVITDLVILRDYEYLNRNLKLHTSFRHQWPCQNAVCLFGKKKNQILYYMHISTDLFITGYPKHSTPKPHCPLCHVIVPVQKETNNNWTMQYIPNRKGRPLGERDMKDRCRI